VHDDVPEAELPLVAPAEDVEVRLAERAQLPAVRDQYFGPRLAAEELFLPSVQEGVNKELHEPQAEPAPARPMPLLPLAITAAAAAAARPCAVARVHCGHGLVVQGIADEPGARGVVRVPSHDRVLQHLRAGAPAGLGRLHPAPPTPAVQCPASLSLSLFLHGGRNETAFCQKMGTMLILIPFSQNFSPRWKPLTAKVKLKLKNCL